MNTFIGACNELYEADIDEALIAKAKIVYGEGYMWDQDCAKLALKKAFSVAKAQGAKVAFTLSDVFCVERSRDEFLKMIAVHELASNLLPKQNFFLVLVAV